MKRKPFWQMDSSKIKVVDVYEAQVVDEEDDWYLIEFFNERGEIVEGEFRKTEFADFPYLIKINSSFGIVVFEFKDNTGLHISAWPLEKYWNKSLL